MTDAPFDQAIEMATGLLRQAQDARIQAQKWGPDTTYGDTGLSLQALAAQLTAEGQAWATLAQAQVLERGHRYGWGPVE